MSLSEKTADALLDKLSSDDAFRSAFQADPRQALASLGHADAADPNIVEGAWTCMAVRQLASKEAIRNARQALHRQLTAARSAHSPIALETPTR